MMRRLILIFLSLALIGGLQACDYGTVPGEDGQYGVEGPSGSRSSGLVVPATGTQTQQPAVSEDKAQQQDNSGTPDSNAGKSPYQSGVGKVVSPLHVNKGTRTHGDPKTW